MEFLKKIKSGHLVLLPIYLISALSIPYLIVALPIMGCRERRFAESMKRKGRTITWADFIRQVNDGKGTLIDQRFSWVGPIRRWWTTDNVHEICPYPLANWFKMLQGLEFDSARAWFHQEYTGPTGRALLVIGDKDQWDTIRGDRPRTFRAGVKHLEVPPPPARKSM